MPSGGSGSAPTSSAPTAAKVEVKEEKAAPKEEEADVDMGGLFGDY